MLRGLHFHRDGVCHAFEVALVPVHDDYLLFSVIFVCHLLAKGLNSCLDESLLCINIKKTVPLIGVFRQLDHPLVEQIQICKILISHSPQLSSNLLSEFSPVSIDGEEMAIGVPLNI